MHIHQKLAVGFVALVAGCLSAEARNQNFAVSVERPIVPVLVGNGASPVEKIIVVANSQSVSNGKSSFTVDLSGTTDIADIQSIGLYQADKKGNLDSDNPVCVTSSFCNRMAKLTCRLADTGTDTLAMWLAVTLRDSVNLKHRIDARCTAVGTPSGKTKVADSRPKPLRVGVALRRKGQDGVASSRIPGIATSTDGTLLAIFDARHDSKRDLQGNIDIAMHRSLDGGTTWQPIQTILDMGKWGGLPEKYNGVSDACILVDKNTGDIFVAGLWMHGALDDNGQWIEGLNDDSTYWIHQWRKKGSQPGRGLKQTCQFLIARSSDDGLTWSFPHNITTDTKPMDWWLFAPAPGQGITLQDGTLVFPSQGRDASGKAFSNITYSTDHGKSWATSNPAYTDVTECNAVQLTDGSIMLNMRDNRNRGNSTVNGRRICTTSDLGNTWTEHATSHRILTEPTCMASLHRHDFTDSNGKCHNLILFANPNHHSLRKNMTLKTSFDQGETWPERNWILFDETRGAGYSSITSVDDHTIGILYESGLAELVFIQIDINEII